MAHPVMWFEVFGKDGGKLQQFYGRLFGWTINADNPMKYGVVDTGAGRGIPGGVGQVQNGGRAWVTFYVETPNITASLAEAVRLGGKTIMPRTVTPDVIMGVFEDPEGHVIGLVEPQAA